MLKQGYSLEETIKAYEEFGNDTQQSSDVSRMSNVQLEGSIMQLFTMYKSSQRQYLSKEVNAIKSLFQKGGTSPKNIIKVAKVMTIYHVLLPVMFQFISNFGGWDEEDKKEYIRAALLGSLDGLFIFGDIIGSAIRQALNLKVWDVESPVQGSLKDLSDSVISAAEKVSVDDISFEDVFDAIKELKGAAQTFGIPVKTAKNMYSGIESLLNKDFVEGVALLSGWSEYAIGKTPNQTDKTRDFLRRINSKPNLDENDIDSTLLEYKKEGELTEKEVTAIKAQLYYKGGLKKDNYEEAKNYINKINKNKNLTEDEINSTLESYKEDGVLNSKQISYIKSQI